MPSKAVEVATEVVSVLNAHSFSMAFTAIRSYADWDIALKDLGTLRVDVVPFWQPSVPLDDRQDVDYQVAVDIAVRFRFDDLENGHPKLADVDSYMALTEEIGDYLTYMELEDSQAIWTSTDYNSSYIPRHLRDLHQFTAIVRVSFDAPKQVRNL